MLIASDVHIITNNDGNPGYDRNSILNTNNFNFTANNLYLGVNGQLDEYAVFNAGSSIVDINGDVTVYATDANGSSVINAASSNWTVSGDWTNNDSFNAGTSTVVLDGTGSINSGANVFYNLTTGAASQVTTLADDLTVINVLTIADASGALTDNAAGYDIKVIGNGTPFVNNGASVTAKNFIYSNPNAITVTVAGGTYNVTEALIFDSQNMGAGTLFELNGDLVVNGAGAIKVTSLTTGLARLDTSLASHNVTASSLLVAESLMQAGFFIANNSIIDINGDVEFINSANTTIDLGGSNWSVAGDWSNNSNNFSAGTSTVTFDGTSQQINGSTSFYNLTSINATNDGIDNTLIFDNTATQTITGTLTIDGLDDDDRINLVSDSLGNQWEINLTAAATKVIDFVDVTDSDASASDVSHKAFDPADSIDSGNNLDWFSNIAPVGQPVITGTVTEDQILTADTSGISDGNGLGAFSYQWLRDGVNIGGATASTYTLGDADVGGLISVQVSYTDGLGTPESVTSVQTAAVVNINDMPVGLPVITGTVTEDQILTADTSGISDADGLGAFSYQWLRDGVAIGGATASTYTLGDADVGNAN